MKTFLGSLAVFIAFASYVPYFRDIFKRHTRPHAFSWLVWSLMNAIAFAAQIVKGGGSGAWVTAATGVVSFSVFMLSLHYGERKFSAFDWWSLAGAIIGLILWGLTNEPTVAIILLTMTDALGFFPTLRKGYYKPFEETAITFAFASLKFLIALAALESFSLATWLYPGYLVVANGLFVVMLVVRRRQLALSTAAELGRA